MIAKTILVVKLAPAHITAVIFDLLVTDFVMSLQMTLGDDLVALWTHNPVKGRMKFYVKLCFHSNQVVNDK